MGKPFMNYDDVKQFLFRTTYQRCISPRTAHKPAWDDHQHIFVVASIVASAKGKSDLLIANSICMHACVRMILAMGIVVEVKDRRERLNAENSMQFRYASLILNARLITHITVNMQSNM